MNFTPVGDRILVRRDPLQNTTDGGIILTESVKPQIGEVLAVGDGVWVKGERKSPPFEVGEEVMFGKWSGEEIEIEKETFLLLTTEDIIGRIKR